MKAIQLKKPYDLAVIEIEKPRPAKDEALIKIISAGICGSDIGAYRGVNGLVSYPRIIGHELAGIVEEAGAEVTSVKTGDRVIIDPYIYCGTCYPCSIGRTNCCEDLKVLGVQTEGGMAEYVCHPAKLLIKVPDKIPWKLVPIAEPLTIALHGLHRGKAAKGEHVAIFGAGTIGLLAAMAALEYGAVPIMIDIVQERLNMAKKMGIPFTVNSAAENVTERIAAITNGRNAEMVMEASGSNTAIRTSLDIAAHAGRIVFTGWPKKMTELPTDVITKKELDIRGARTSAGEFEEALQLIAENRVDVSRVLTKVIAITEVPETIKDIEQNPGDYLKVNVMLEESDL